jgi:hypothetical protein
MVWWGTLRISLFSIAFDTLELVFQKLLTNPPFHHNVYASIVWELTAQNLINRGCSIKHANASNPHSTCLSLSLAALDIFVAKSSMVGIFAILDIQTLRISPYPPSFPNLGTTIMCAFFGIYTTPPPMFCYMAAFKAYILHNTFLVSLLENLATKSWTFCNFLWNSKSLEFHSPSSLFLKTYSKESRMFNVLEMICWSNHLPCSQSCGHSCYTTPSAQGHW